MRFLSPETMETLVRATALLASVFSQGTMVGHSPEDTEARADRYVAWITGRDRG